jgi:hypothetical protein
MKPIDQAINGTKIRKTAYFGTLNWRNTALIGTSKCSKIASELFLRNKVIGKNSFNTAN